jgi:glycosyltransferase
MRVAIAIWPAPAHVYPLTPLAWALRAAGHEVSFISHPSIGPEVAAQGLPFTPACTADAMPGQLGPGGAYPAEREDTGRISAALHIPEQDLGIWNTVFQFFLPAMWDFIPYRGSPDAPMPAMDGMVEFFEQWRPDLVVWDPCLPGASVAARVCGARHVRYTGPDLIGWCHETFDRLTSGPSAPDVDNPLVESVRPMARKYGVPVDRETLFGQCTVNPAPPALSVPVDTRTVPVRWIPHTSQGAGTDWLYPVPDRPRVAISLGVSVRSFLAADWHYVPVLLDALSGMDVEVIATLDHTQLNRVSTIPDNVRVVDYFPLDQLLPTCSALIHHGGLATTIAAGNARVPQLIVDFLDRDIVADTSVQGVGVPRYVMAPTATAYVQSHGAGDVLDLSKPSAEVVREQVTRVLTDPSFRSGATRLYEDLLASPSPTDIVPVLEKLAHAA